VHVVRQARCWLLKLGIVTYQACAVVEEGATLFTSGEQLVPANYEAVLAVVVEYTW
jgi:hypothetical protein